MATASKPLPPARSDRLAAPKPAARGAAFDELSCVVLLVPATTYDTGAPVPVGTRGTVVFVHGEGAAYDVEFTAPVGVAAVRGEDLKAA